MDYILSKWAYWLVKLRWVALGLALSLTVIFGYFASQIHFDFSPEAIFLSDDPAHEFYVTRFKKEFGKRGDTCLVAIDGPVRSQDTQKALFELHQKLSQNKEITSVHSLANTNVLMSENDELSLKPIFDEKGNVDQKRLDWAVNDPAINGLLVAKDLSAVAIAIRLPLHTGQQVIKERIAHQLQSAVDDVASRFPQIDFYLTGTTMTEAAAISSLKRDQIIFIPLVMVFMAALLWLSFRNWRGVFLPFSVTTIATIWAIGWIVLMGHSLNVVNNSVIVLLLVIGISDAVQIIARFEAEVLRAKRLLKENQEEISRATIVERTVRAMTIPCLLTSSTTALGFASSGIIDVEIVRHFGLDTAVGVMGSYVATMLILPAMLRFLPLPKNLVWPPKARFKMLSVDEALGKIAHFSMHYAKTVLGIALFLTAVAFGIAKDIEPNQRLVSELPADHPSVLALNFVEKKLTGIIPFDIVFEGKPGRISEPEVIRKAAEFAQFSQKLPTEPTARSFGDVLASFDRSLTGKTSEIPVSEWSNEKIAQLLLLIDSSDPDTLEQAKADFFSSDGRFLRILGLSKDANIQDMAALRKALEEKIAATHLEGIKIHLTGTAPIMANALGSIMTDMIKSLAFAIITIFVLFLLLFWSLKFGFIALFPNLLPIVMTMAAMQLFGISMRIATVLIFSMALGIAVNATIYLLSRFREEGKHGELESVLDRTMRGAGRPVVYSTFLLLVGFSVMGLSKFHALRDFSFLSTILLGTALVVDLFLFPALVVLVKPRLGPRNGTIQRFSQKLRKRRTRSK